MKQFLLCLLVFALLLFLLFHPAEGLLAAQNGLNLWLHILVPTLLPFIILTNIILNSGILNKILNKTHVFAIYPYLLLVGVLCGYPMGAKCTAEFYQNGYLSYPTAQFFLTFINNPSPIFLSSYVCIQCLNKKELAAPAFFILYGADFCSAILLFFLQKKFALISISPIAKKEKPISHPKERGIDFSIMNGFETMTRLGGYILIFSILSAFIHYWWKWNLPGKSLVLCLTEISTGLMYLKSASLSFPLTCALAFAATSFGGLCITGQTNSILKEYHISITPYLISKILSCLLTFCFSLFFIQ